MTAEEMYYLYDLDGLYKLLDELYTSPYYREDNEFMAIQEKEIKKAIYWQQEYNSNFCMEG